MDYVALGHIHSLSPLKIAGGTAYAYPGCTEGRGFDETGEKGALLVTLSEENGVSAEFVPLPGVRYDIVTADIGAAEPLEAVLGALSGLPAGGACRILLKGECEELPDVNLIRKKLDGRFRELQIRDETTRKINLWEQAGLDTLSGVFIGKLAAMEQALEEYEGLFEKYGVLAERLRQAEVRLGEANLRQAELEGAIMEKREAEQLYSAFGKAFFASENWNLYLLSSHTEFERTFGRPADKKRKLYNGMIKCDLYMYLK